MKYVSFSPSYTQPSTNDRIKETVVDTGCQTLILTLGALLTGGGSKTSSTPSKKQISRACAGTIATVPQQLGNAVANAESKYGVRFTTTTDDNRRITYSLDASTSLSTQIANLTADIATYKTTNLATTANGATTQNNLDAYVACKGELDAMVADYNAMKSSQETMETIKQNQPAWITISQNGEASFNESTWQTSQGGAGRPKDYAAELSPSIVKQKNKDNSWAWNDVKGTEAYKAAKRAAELQVKQYNDAFKKHSEINQRRNMSLTELGGTDGKGGKIKDKIDELQRLGNEAVKDGTKGGTDCRTYLSTLQAKQQQLAKLNALQATYQNDIDEINAMQEELSFAYEHHDAEESVQKTKNVAKNTRKKGILGGLFNWKPKTNRMGGQYDSKAHSAANNNAKLAQLNLDRLNAALLGNWTDD